ncbi:ABC transporter permease [Rhodococcus erythropolis]|uniref:ABC transporter permease n=1 Tax=Rhodococcus erythropolis TaxID=1833 RepID=UPI0038225C4F
MGLLAAILIVWELISGRIVDDLFISRPSAIADQWFEWAREGTLWYNASSTFAAAGIGFVLGGTVAIIVGYILAGSPTVAATVEPFLTAIYSLPKAALVPLFVLWFGIGIELPIMVCALVTFFLMFYNTFFGLQEVDRGLIDAVKILGGTRRDIAWNVKMPSALVWVAAGLKISIPQALVGVVVAEILAGNRGLGYLVSVNAGQFNSAGTFAAIATLLAVGLIFDRIAAAITRRALRWKTAATT